MATSKQVYAFRKVNLGASNAGRALSADSQPVLVSLAGVTKVSVHVVSAGTTAPSSSIVEAKVGNTNDDFVSVPGGSVTLTGVGMMTAIDVTAWAWLAIDVTTVQSGASADIFVCCYGEK